MRTPREEGFQMPPEWGPHAGCWMGWPCQEETYTTTMEAARDAYAAVARAIARFEPVTMLANPEHAADAADRCGDAVSVVEMPLSDSWMRDTGPTFVTDGIAGVDWRFNAWGGNYAEFRRDEAVAGTVLERLGLVRYPAPIVMEGGALHTDGAGTVMTTTSVPLNGNRNPGLACFLAEGVVAAMEPCEAGDEMDAALTRNLETLMAQTDAQGRGLSIVRLPRPRRILWQDVPLPASYVNFYPANGAVIMPSFDDPMDEVARDRLAAAMPGRTVVQLPAVEIIRGGGGIHCITQQQPAVP